MGVVVENQGFIVRSIQNQSNDDIAFGTVLIRAAGGSGTAAVNTVNPNGAKPADSTAATTNFVGIAVKQVKTQLGYYPAPNGAVYADKEQMSMLVFGTVTMKCYYGTPTAGAAVYLRTVANSSNGGVVGGLDATADGVDNFKLPFCYWAGMPDENGVDGVVFTQENHPV